MRVISVAETIGFYPGGRLRTDSSHSGQEFREDYLEPVFQTDEVVEVDLDRVLGYASCFLDEAFGGLVRKGIPADRVRAQLRLRSVHPSIIEEINRYIDEAEKRCRMHK